MSDERPDPASRIRVVGGNPTPEEVAAVTAVLSAALDESAGEHRRRSARGASEWERRRRGIRGPLVRGRWGTLGD